MSGLFGTFHIATSGLFAQQRAIDVTSHNIANGKTEGYSRQRVELETTRPFPMPSMNNAVGPGQMGTGVYVKSIDRVRDNFLDYQVRVEMGVDGQFKGRDKFLAEVENVFNEPTDTGVSTLIGKFFDSWNTLGTSAKESNARSIVSQQAQALTNELNHTYSELESLKSNTQLMIKDTVFNVNSVLDQVNQLNQQIIQVKVSGNNPNDLMDRRDLLLDKLSNDFGIKVDKKAFEGIDVTTSNEGKYASAGDNGNPPILSGGGPVSLIKTVTNNPNDNARFSYVQSIEPKKDGADGEYTVTYYTRGDSLTDANKRQITVKMTDEEKKKMDECRVLWSNEKGEAFKGDGNVPQTINGTVANDESVEFKNLMLFPTPTGQLKGYMSVQSDIDNYEDKLNKFAKSLAFAVNGIISQNTDTAVDTDMDINNFFVNADAEKSGDYRKDKSAVAIAEQGITAANITINADIMKDPMKIKTATKYDANGKALTGESDGHRALAVEMLRDRLMAIQNMDFGGQSTTKKAFLEGILTPNDNLGVLAINNKIGGMTLDSYFKDCVDKLGIQEQEAKRMVGNQAKLLSNFTESRNSVSGVSLDEEMVNLIQFQHCYQANAKIISTVDQLLDVVVNGLKR